MGRNCEIVLVDDGRPRAGAPPRALRRAAAGRRGRAGDARARSSPSGIPTPCRSSPSATGIAHYVDLVEGVSMREVIDEATGISIAGGASTGSSSRAAPTCGRASRCATRRARCVTLANGLEARYFLSVDAILSVENGAAGQGRRRAGAHPARVLEDPRHHRRSAARGRAVRGAQAEGLRDHQRDRRAASSSARTTRPSAASSWCPSDGESERAARVPDPEGQAHLACRRATTSSRATC